MSSPDGQPEISKSKYKVGLPPKRRLLSEFKERVKETLFHDDPLRAYKDQPKSRKILLGLRAFFPILDWSRHYNLAKFRGDLIAGLTIASLCIPQVNSNKYYLFFNFIELGVKSAFPRFF